MISLLFRFLKDLPVILALIGELKAYIDSQAEIQDRAKVAREFKDKLKEAREKRNSNVLEDFISSNKS